MKLPLATSLLLALLLGCDAGGQGGSEAREGPLSREAVVEQLSEFDLLAYYPFNGNARDFGPNGYHGTAEGATLTPDWRGRPNRAYAFDGDDRVALGDVLNEIRVPFTVATWVRFTEDSVGSLFHSDLYPRTEPDSMYYGVGLQITHWDLRVHYTSGGPIGPQSRRSKYSSPVGLHDRWVHVIGVVRGPQDMSLYMNGRDIGGYYSGSGGPLRHNFWQAVIGDRFRGSMDDVMIFDRALSAHEVALLYRLMHADQA